eukprot:604794-Rhodomonas_salina.2
MLPFLTQELVTAARTLRACSPNGGGGKALEFEEMGTQQFNPEQGGGGDAVQRDAGVVWDGADEGLATLVEAIAFVRKEAAILSAWPLLTVQIALNEREGSLPNRAAKTVLNARAEGQSESETMDGKDDVGVVLERKGGEGVPME